MTTSTVIIWPASGLVAATLDRSAKAAVEVPAVPEVGQEGIGSELLARLLDARAAHHEPPVKRLQPRFDARRHRPILEPLARAWAEREKGMNDVAARTGRSRHSGAPLMP